MLLAVSHVTAMIIRGTPDLRSRHYCVVPRRCGVAGTRLCTIDEDAGLLAGSFWNELKEEAMEEAEARGLTIRSMKYGNGKLSIKASGAGIDELQQLNLHLSGWIDNDADQEIVESLPPFLLQVSSPGLSPVLTSDLDFAAFKGFPVLVTTSEPFKSKTSWEGTLVGRDGKHVTINLKGRQQKIPIDLVSEVRMPDAKREAGDMLAT